MKSKSLALITLLIVLMLSTLTTSGASAAAPDAPWTAGGTGSTTATSDGRLSNPVLDYSVTGFSGSWTFTAKSTLQRQQSISWRYKGYHAWFRVRVAMEKFVIRDGQEIVKEPLVAAGPVNCCAAPSGGFDYTGATTFDLRPGDIYGFRMSGSHYDSDQRLIGTLTLTPPADPTDADRLQEMIRKRQELFNTLANIMQAQAQTTANVAAGIG